MSTEADVIIVGAGVAGAIPAAMLAPRGVRVMLLDAGPPVDRQNAVDDYRMNPIRVPESAYPDVSYAPRPTVIAPNGYYVQEGPDDFKSTYERRVGGSTWHWLGTALRLMPDDFRTRSAFGQGVDWPISYQTLEPWYGKAESELGVSGVDSPGLGAPRSTPYPMPPIPASYMDEQVRKGAAKLGLTVDSTPQARNSVQRQGRPPCCGNSSCIPVCPVAAKYDATVHVNRAVKAGARLISSAVVVNVQVEPGLATVTYRPEGGSEVQVTAKTVVLAANAIETPKLMLMSRGDGQANGLGNDNDLVGRFLMDHPIQLSWALAPNPTYPYRGPLSTSGIESTRNGSFRRQRAPFRVEIQNPGWSFPLGDPTSQAQEWAATQDIGEAGFAKFSNHLLRQVCLTGATEQLPNADNRVELSDRKDAIGVPRPQLSYAPGAYSDAGRVAAKDLFTKIFQAMGCTDIQHRDTFEGAGHLMGTTRMGNNPATSVVDKDLRLHGHRNCFVLGAGVFPSVGTANPTLTIAALSLRAVGAIGASLTE